MNLATTLHLPAPRQGRTVVTTIGRGVQRHPRATLGSVAVLATWIGITSLVRRRRNHDVTEMFRSEPRS